MSEEKEFPSIDEFIEYYGCDKVIEYLNKYFRDEVLDTVDMEDSLNYHGIDGYICQKYQEEILSNFHISEIISHYGENELLNEIQSSYVVSYFGEAELLSEMDLEYIVDNIFDGFDESSLRSVFSKDYIISNLFRILEMKDFINGYLLNKITSAYTELDDKSNNLYKIELIYEVLDIVLNSLEKTTNVPVSIVTQFDKDTYEKEINQIFDDISERFDSISFLYEKINNQIAHFYTIASLTKNDMKTKLEFKNKSMPSYYVDYIELNPIVNAHESNYNDIRVKNNLNISEMNKIFDMADTILTEMEDIKEGMTIE